MSENISAKLSAQANEIRSTSSLRPDAQEIPTPQHLAKILSVENTQQDCKLLLADRMGSDNEGPRGKADSFQQSDSQQYLSGVESNSDYANSDKQMNANFGDYTNDGYNMGRSPLLPGNDYAATASDGGQSKQRQTVATSFGLVEPPGESITEKLGKFLTEKMHDVSEALPLIGAGHSMEADMIFGWRPENVVISGAPIPLLYNYEPIEVPCHPHTGKEMVPIYLGPRPSNSLEVHRAFANKALNTDSPVKVPAPTQKQKEKGGLWTGNGELTSCQAYTFKFPIRHQLLKRQESVREFVGMNPELDMEEEQEQELKFDSQFESGNLDMVIKKSGLNDPAQPQERLYHSSKAPTDRNKAPRPAEYDLYMRVDTNTRGHHQWFYFSVEYEEGSPFAGQTVKFNVVNFTKKASLYTYGMRVCICRRSGDYKWHKGGENVTYGTSHVQRSTSRRPYAKLSFTHKFEEEAKGDKVYFAYCFPYTFSRLQNFLKSIGPVQKDYCKETFLCKSLSGLDVPLVTISSRIRSDPENFNLIKMEEFDDENSKLSLPFYKRKKYVVIGSRVHPGESNSSWMMQGFIKSLLGNSHQAVQLRKRVVFKVIPMVNPDGVITGNYRTSMSGNDLNRQYHNPNSRLHPTVCAIKKICNLLTYGQEPGMRDDIGGEKISNAEDILAFIDMHGHSRKKNVFIYGPQVPLHSDKYYKMRIIPKLLSEETHKFRYPSCRFKLEKSKLKTARIVLWREFAIENCFTFEASFHGYFDNKNVNYEFTETNYESMGAHLVNSLYEYLMILEETDRRKKLKELNKKNRKKKLAETAKQHSQRANPIKLEAQKQYREQGEQLPHTESSSKLTAKQRSLMEKRTASQGSLRNKRKSPTKVSSQINDEEKEAENLRRQTSADQASFHVTGTSVQSDDVMQNNPNEPPSEVVQRARQQESDEESKQQNKGFRNLQDLFKDLKQADEQDSESDEERMEPGTDDDADSEGTIEGTKSEGNDELSNEEQMRLHKNIINVIKEFSSLNNMEQCQQGVLANMRGVPRPKNKNKKKKRKEEGVLNLTKPDDKKDKTSNKDKAAKVKEQSTVTSTASKGLPSRKQSQSHTQNYQNYTVSIAQKRRSQQEREELAQGRRPKNPQNNLTYYNFTKPTFLNEQIQNPMVVFQDKNTLPPHLQQYLAQQPQSQGTVAVAGNSKGIINFSFQPTAPQNEEVKKNGQQIQQETVMKTNQFPAAKTNNPIQLSHQQQWQLMQQQQQSQRASGAQQQFFAEAKKVPPPSVTVHHNSFQKGTSSQPAPRTRNPNDVSPLTSSSVERFTSVQLPLQQQQLIIKQGQNWQQYQNQRFLLPQGNLVQVNAHQFMHHHQTPDVPYNTQSTFYLHTGGKQVTKDDLGNQSAIPFQFKVATSSPLDSTYSFQPENQRPVQRQQSFPNNSKGYVQYYGANGALDVEQLMKYQAEGNEELRTGRNVLKQQNQRSFAQSDQHQQSAAMDKRFMKLNRANNNSYQFQDGYQKMQESAQPVHYQSFSAGSHVPSQALFRYYPSQQAGEPTMHIPQIHSAEPRISMKAPKSDLINSSTQKVQTVLLSPGALKHIQSQQQHHTPPEYLPYRDSSKEQVMRQLNRNEAINNYLKSTQGKNQQPPAASKQSLFSSTTVHAQGFLPTPMRTQEKFSSPTKPLQTTETLFTSDILAHTDPFHTKLSILEKERACASIQSHSTTLAQPVTDRPQIKPMTATSSDRRIVKQVGKKKGQEEWKVEYRGTPEVSKGGQVAFVDRGSGQGNAQSLNLISQGRRHQMINTPTRRDKDKEMLRQQNKANATNLEKLNAHLRHGQNNNKLRQQVGSGGGVEVVGQEGEAVVEVASSAYYDQRGKQQNQNNNDVYYYSVDQTSGQTRIITVQNQSVSTDRYQTLTDPHQQVSKRTSQRIQPLQNLPQAQKKNTNPLQQTYGLQTGVVDKQLVNTSISVGSEQSGVQQGSGALGREFMNNREHTGALHPKYASGDNYMINSQQWPRGALASSGGVLSLNQRIQSSTQQNSGVMSNRGGDASLVNLEVEKKQTPTKQRKYDRTAKPPLMYQESSPIKKKHLKGGLHHEQMISSETEERRSHVNLQESNHQIIMMNSNSKSQEHQSKTMKNMKAIKKEATDNEYIESAAGSRLKKNTVGSINHSPLTWNQSNVPQQSIVHMNQSLQENQNIRSPADPQHGSYVGQVISAVGPLEDQTALSLGPEVKGKCFPPGRTSNVFNMQRQKYQFVARKQAQVKGGGHSATNQQPNAAQAQQQAATHKKIPSQHAAKRNVQPQQFAGSQKTTAVQPGKQQTRVQSTNVSPTVVPKQPPQEVGNRAQHNSSQNRGPAPIPTFSNRVTETAGVVVNQQFAQAVAMRSAGLNRSDSKKRGKAGQTAVVAAPGQAKSIGSPKGIAQGVTENTQQFYGQVRQEPRQQKR